MPKRKRRSAAQLAAAKRGSDTRATYWDEIKKAKKRDVDYRNMLKTRRELIHSQRRGRRTSPQMILLLLLLFLQIINVQLIEGLSRYEAVDKIAMYSDKNKWRLRASYDHYIKTGNVLQVSRVGIVVNAYFGSVKKSHGKTPRILVKRVKDITSGDVLEIHKYVHKCNQTKGEAVSTIHIQ